MLNDPNMDFVKEITNGDVAVSSALPEKEAPSLLS